MSNEKARDRALTILQTLINATGALFENEELATDCIAEELQAYADQETVSLKERVRELEEGIREINNIAWEIWYQHCQEDATLDKAENITAKINNLLTNNQHSDE